MSNHDQLNCWYILGPGAVGCLWASLLKAAGQDVVLIARDAGDGALTANMVDLEYSQDPSLRTNGGGGAGGNPQPTQSFTLAKTTAYSLGQYSGRINRLLIATKAYDALDAIASVLPSLAEDATVITLCNGLGLHDACAEALQQAKPAARLLAAVSSEGARLEDSLKVVHTGRGLTRIGFYTLASTENDSQALQTFLQKLLPSELNIKWQAENNIRLAILQKALVNCVINPLTALYGCKNGELLENPSYQHLFAALSSELQRVYDACLVLPSFAPVENADREFLVLTSASEIAAATASNQSSMLSDVIAERPLELEALNVYVLAIAERLNIDCPINRQLIDALKKAL